MTNLYLGKPNANFEFIITVKKCQLYKYVCAKLMSPIHAHSEKIEKRKKPPQIHLKSERMSEKP